MLKLARCWWCGFQAEVDTELPESGGLVKDSDTSWLCTDNAACVARTIIHGKHFNLGRP